MDWPLLKSVICEENIQTGCEAWAGGKFKILSSFVFHVKHCNLKKYSHQAVKTRARSISGVTEENGNI